MKEIFLILLLCPLFVTHCYAEDILTRINELDEMYSIQNSLTDQEREISGEARLDGQYDTQGALHRLWLHLMDALRTQLGKEASSALELYVLAMFSALACCFCKSKTMIEIVDRIGCCSAALLTADGLNGLFSQAVDAVQRLADYGHTVLPVLFSAAAVGGFLSASGRYAAACLVIDVLLTAAQNCIIPCIYAYFALIIAESLFNNGILRAVSRLFKWIITTAMTILGLAFGTYLSLTSLIAGSSDAVAVKTARTVIARSIPIVGGLLSDSASVLLAAAGMIRTSIGVFALVSVCVICVGPLAVFSVKLLVWKTIAASVDFLSESKLPGLINNMATVFGMLLGLIGISAIMLFISIVSGMKAVYPS